MIRSNIKLKATIKILLALLVLVFCFTIINLFTATTTLSSLDEVWDGVEVATSFSGGNGSKENPYQIRNGQELAYLKKVVEENLFPNLKDQYFVLESDIDLGGQNWQGISTTMKNSFSGHLDGKGYTIKNFKISTPTIINDIEYYSFFNIVKDAEIKNINFNNETLVTNISNNSLKAALIVGTVLNNTKISNVAVSDSNIDLSKTLPNYDNKIGGMFAETEENVLIENVYNQAEIKDINSNSFGNIFGTLNGRANNMITQVTYTNFLSVNVKEASTISNTATLENSYQLVTNNNDLYVSNTKDLTLDDILYKFNKNIDDSYQWIKSSLSLKITVKETNITKKPETNIPQYFNFGKSASITLHETGITDTTVYVNDLESDYDYYIGLNYTESKTGTIPSGENQKIYTDNNLVKSYIKYSGVDANNSNLVGHVSLTEQQSEFIYYKYYVVENGYVTIELIDNPFADHPNDKGFNGWVTDYPNAKIIYDSDTYTRYVQIPVTYTNGIPDTINITFNSSWLDGNIGNLTNSSGWNQAFSTLKDIGMEAVYAISNHWEDMSNYYIKGETGWFGRHPDGAYDERLNDISGDRCSSFGGCTYYIKSGPDYDSSQTYYKYNGQRLEEYTPHMVEGDKTELLPVGSLAAGTYKKIKLNRGMDITGYYDYQGNYQTGGTCNSTSCEYYELQQYYNPDGSINLITEDGSYYYLVTRDMNMIVLQTDTESTWNSDKPFTLTGIYNDKDYSDNMYYINRNEISAQADTRVEYLTIYSTTRYSTSNPTSSASSTNYIYGNWHNLKLGRGIKSRGNNYVVASSVIGGNNNSTGSSDNITKYKLIIESGIYNTTGIVNGATTSSRNDYIKAQSVYGNDYDRVTKNNSNLEVYFSAVGSWGGNIRTSSEPDALAIDLTVKSGEFGTSKDDVSTGLYVGGRAYGTHYATKRAIIEGGWIYNVNGGPLTASSRSQNNETYTYMKGGEADFIFGGAGTSETYGNRIIGVTGGTVNYSVFGGSNGYEGRNGDGVLSGEGFIYVGGHAVIGKPDYVSNDRTTWGAEAGSIFGIGNGKSNYTSIGSASGSTVIVDANATVNRNVYGGGNYGYVGTSRTTQSDIKILGGTIKGSVYGGGNNNGSGTSNIDATININMTGGTVEGSIYGGSRQEGIVYGSTNINVQNGTINTDVYGGGEGGYQSSSNSGTFVRDDVNVTIGTKEIGPTITGSVYGGSAYGTVNGTSNTGNANNKTTEVTVNQGIVKNAVYGGGKGSSTYTPKVYGNVTTNINGGNIANVFGGNNLSGSPSGTDTVYLNSGTIGNAFGGGNQTGQTRTNILLQGANVNKLYGGSNEKGTVETANVTVTNGIAINVYGGNNIGGKTETTNLSVTGGTITGDVYGGGSKADTTDTNITLGNATINNVYGGGEEASATTTKASISDTKITNYFGGSNISGTVNTTTTTINSGTITNFYGGNNQGGTTSTTTMTINNGTIGSVYGGGNKASSTFSNITVNNGQITNIFGGGNEAGLNTSNLNINNGTIGNIYGGSNQSGNITTSNLEIGKSESNTLTIDNIFGGNNMGGITARTNVDIGSGTIGTIYGGGNEAEVNESSVNITNSTVTNIFGGGNKAKISGNTKVTVANTTVNTNIYGGGNEGEVAGNTDVLLTSTNVLGSAYAGGNGATAIVHKNTTITVEGKTVIGTKESKAPHSGCLFGSGNAAATGTESVNNSYATVNLAGAKIYGNVYGGANTSVVFGKTDTNIGTNAIDKKGLQEESIMIGGTVFGGGEANAEGDENYDYSFISVTGAIDIDIDGKNYLNNGHAFEISGSIFGSGNASSSSGTSNIYIGNLGTRKNPSKNISIQRANSVVLDNTTMELKGTTDRTNEYSDIKYSLNRIDELNIKNNAMLLLQKNANLLKSLKSTVDINGKEEKAAVIIDDDTKTVTKNVDNRLYMLANQNLNVTTNESATAYGEITGMTFFGMYNRFSNGSFQYGLYEDSVNYGDPGDAGDIIIGGSYVLGLHSLNHDITVDGFYSNFIDDAYTEISTSYIEPTPPDSNYYMWSIGLNAINYSFAMTASKYSSLGTYELSMREFSSGDTIFDVIGFNSEGLTSGVELIDSNEVPKVGDTEEDTNSVLGLSMKTETSEWTSYGTTKLLSDKNGSYTGDTTYKTDSQALAPSLMFYLYHAKNITLNQELGTVVVTLQAKTPINEIEYDVQLITITIDLIAKNYDDGNSYDASITYDKQYEMPAATTVNITNQSQFTTYYDLFAESDTFEDFYGRNNSNYHALVTDYALPVGTQITMLDYGAQTGIPEYYYYTITEKDYNDALKQLEQDNEVTYKLNNFIKMGSTSSDNTYDDKVANKTYYDEEKKRTIEEFIFIFDFKETTTTGDHLNKYMRFELRNEEDRSLVTVLGIRQNLMYYNLYESSNIVLNQNVALDSNYIYSGTKRNIEYETSVTYDQTANRESIINTNYESTNMGLNITLYDQTGNKVSSSLLTGTSVHMDNKDYFADSEGVFRVKLAGKVSNLKKNLYFLTDSNLPPGNYKMVFTLFASSDGLHNSDDLGYTEKEVNVTVVPADNTINATTEDEMKIINGDTLINEKETNSSIFKITALETLTQPNIRISLYKRNIDNKNSLSYIEIPLESIFSNNLKTPASIGLKAGSEYEMMISETVLEKTTVELNYNEALLSGTYKVKFKLYDNNQLIDDDYEYFIVKKPISY